ncbi:glycosyltransferase family 9 protein [Candidatus Omnitrophota bacterium]
MRYILKNKFYMFLISVIDFLGSIIFFPFKIFRKKSPGNIGNVLVIRLDHLGDVIFSTPIPQNIKEHYKGAKITFLVGSAAKEIIMNNPYIDEVICYDAPWFSRSNRKFFALLGFLKVAKELRKYSYDIGFDLRGDFRHIILMAIVGVKFKVSYGITGGGFLLHKKVEYRDNVHAIEHNLDLLRSMDVKITTEKLQLQGSTRDEEFMSKYLKSNNLSEDNKLAVIHTSAGYPSKNWLNERFAKLIRILNEDFGFMPVLIGSEEDKGKNDEIIHLSNIAALNAAGVTTIGTLLALIKKSTIFIGIDSGPSHIAALGGLPSIILYSGTNQPGEWAPKNNKAIIIQKDIPCKGCERLDCEHNICMDMISVDDVVEAVRGMLEKPVEQGTGVRVQGTEKLTPEP